MFKKKRINKKFQDYKDFCKLILMAAVPYKYLLLASTNILSLNSFSRWILHAKE